MNESLSHMDESRNIRISSNQFHYSIDTAYYNLSDNLNESLSHISRVAYE